MTHIYNVSLRSGVFPLEWKLAKVKPLYKKGDRYDIQNYRPISIISVFAKLLERFMFNRLIPFFYENKILTEAQNGFRKGKCVETAVQSFIEINQEALDKGVHSIGIFIDLTKAYDTLNHKVFFFFFQALNFLVESFGLLNDLFPLPSILDAGYPVFDLHLADVLFDVILPSVLGSSL